ncbi:pilus assembly protein [Litorilituus lipolyticus]|nr:PilC/PilY family type IV pilus protein [Litorilituus lipolyticus]
MKKLIAKSLLTLSLLASANYSYSEDIELYVSDVVRQAGKGIKLLIIFDTSGSMNDIDTDVKNTFDSSQTYDPIGVSHAYNDDALYFNVAGADGVSTIPTSPSDARRFLADINSCETSKAILEKYGTYTGHIREFTAKGNNGNWTEVPSNNGLNIEVIDCEDDAYIVDSAGTVINEGNIKNSNGLPDGYPRNGLYSKKNPVYHDGSKTSTNIDWSAGKLVTLYTAKYLRWYYDQSVTYGDVSRLQQAKGAITEVIQTTPSIEFGLEVFNFNYGDSSSAGNGGRIVMGIKKMTTSAKTELVDLINDELIAEGATPLCESLYESRQYFAGDKIEFGDDDVNVPSYNYVKNKPPMDSDVISLANNSMYQTPFGNCANSVAHVILITDGKPTYDHAADDKIKALSMLRVKRDANGLPVLDEAGEQVMETLKFTDTPPLPKDGEGPYDVFINTEFNKDGIQSYMPALASWMSNYDISPTTDGVQLVITHTIGFSDGATAAADLLDETAKRGKGSYTHAGNAKELQAAIRGVFNSLSSGNDSLTSASVAANNFDRTQTLDSVYFAMFNPQNASRWEGNLKKYKAVDGDITDVNGNNAICDSNDGIRSFCEGARSFWSPSIDGDDVNKGGVASWFSSLSGVDKRTIYTDSGVGALITYNRENLQKAYTDQAGLALELGVSGETDDSGNDIESQAIDDLLNWSMGMDVDDEDSDNLANDMRNDVFGDPLHSKPLVINYGNTVRIVVGTNAGALHMFEDTGSSVKENWAFMPKEFLKNIQVLRDNYSSGDKVYGIDGEITAHLNDKDGDGIINGTDTAWIFFGLRRGGDSYYALDISTPDSVPQILWHKDSNSTGFSHLGQSWSKPKIGYSSLNVSGTTAKPVVFIGGGYDINKDAPGPGTDDTKGVSAYMLDAQTGTLLWSLTPDGGDKVTTFAGKDSIAAGIAALDSTGNGLTDRLYIADTGGNIWRVDMPGNKIEEFSVFNLAQLGGTTNATDRRFFYEPSIVRTFISETIETKITDKNGKTETVTVHQEIPYDALLIGSGDRSNPLGKDTQDKLYMIKDKNILTQDFNVETVPTVITDTELYNYTDNPFENYESMTTAELETLQIAVSEKSGWYVNLVQSGEKSSAEALAINGIAYYTTYAPPKDPAELVGCKPPLGVGALFAVDLTLGIKRHKNLENVRENDSRFIDINNDFLGKPTLIVLPEDDGDDKTKDKATGDIIVGDEIIQADFTLNTTRLYLYIKEDQ